jgi:hypothetical protein
MKITLIRDKKFAQLPIRERLQNTVHHADLHNGGFNSTDVIRLQHML